jgi:Tfp pilus assembly PilM family ATPase
LGRKSKTRTGIDIGTTSVKIVCGTGTDCLERITHIGMSSWSLDDPDTAADKMDTLLKKLGLGKKQLGRVAVSIGGKDSIVREIAMPKMTDSEFRMALPFEARKYMQAEEGEKIIVDGQIIGGNVTDEETQDMTVVLAATTASDRLRTLDILDRVKIEPHVIDTEPTACLTALLGAMETVDVEDDPTTSAMALLDLGGRRASLYITANDKGFMSRTIWEGEPPAEDADSEREFIQNIATRTLETLTFYRGRYRREVPIVHLMGGGALRRGRTRQLSRALNRDVLVLDPIGTLADGAVGIDAVQDLRPTFTTSCGLCRWGDVHV